MEESSHLSKKKAPPEEDAKLEDRRDLAKL